MTVEYKGCGPSTTLPKDRVVRVTFSHIFAGSFLFVPADFVNQFRDVWDEMATTGARPMTANNASTAEPFTTVDAKVTVAQTAAQLFGKLNTLDWHISVTRLELLTVPQGQTAATTAGAAERDAITQAEKDKAESDSLGGWWKSLGEQLQKQLKVLLWVIVIVAIVVALYWAGKLRNVIKGS